MRPEIPDELANRVESLDDKHGYKSVGEFVREAVREKVTQLEVSQSLSEEVGITVQPSDIEFKPQLTEDAQQEVVEQRDTSQE